MRFSLGLLCAIALPIGHADAQNLTGDWISEGERGKIEIYACGTPPPDDKLLIKLCGHVSKKDSGPRLCGRIKKILPNGLAELEAKGEKEESQLGKAMLCVARSTDKKWPWKGGVYKPDDGNTYHLDLTPEGANKLRLRGCELGKLGGLGGLLCEEFVWTKAGG